MFFLSLQSFQIQVFLTTNPGILVEHHILNLKVILLSDSTGKLDKS